MTKKKAEIKHNVMPRNTRTVNLIQAKKSVKIDIKKLFETEETQHYPEAIRKNLTHNNGQKIENSLVFELFNYKPTLSIDEIVVGIYNLYELIKDRQWVSSQCGYLRTQGKIKNVAQTKGLYEIVK